MMISTLSGRAVSRSLLRLPTTQSLAVYCQPPRASSLRHSSVTPNIRGLQLHRTHYRNFSSAATAPVHGTMIPNAPNGTPMILSRATFGSGLFLAAAAITAGGLLHSATGSQADFFDYRFTTEKSPEDLATFYGGEEFMELFCVFPLVGQLMMRDGRFDDQGNVLTTGLPGTLRVSIVFSDDVDEDTGDTTWFNKRERFRNLCWGWTCWDMVQNFGFRTTEDGKTEVYHYGEYFHGNLPIVSQIMRLVFKVHARWLAWSTEHHINHYAFDADTEKEEELEEDSRRNMPIFLLKNYAWSDLMAMLLGKRVDKPSFLLIKNETSDESATSAKQREQLPLQREQTKLQIEDDIAMDRLTTRNMLARHPTTRTVEDVTTLLTRTGTRPATNCEINAALTAIVEDDDDVSSSDKQLIGTVSAHAVDFNSYSVERESQQRPTAHRVYEAATQAAHQRRLSRLSSRRKSRTGMDTTTATTTPSRSK